MNRRTFLKSVPALAMLASAKPIFSAADMAAIKPEDVIKLNPPDLKKGIPLMAALKKRKSQREFSDKKLSLQQLSELLWAADGVNRPDGKRTSPAAIARYAVDIYVMLPEGVYLYDVAKHELGLITKGDFRKVAGVQDFVFTTPVNLIYVLNLKNWQNLPRPIAQIKRDNWIRFEVGFLAQNVYLYCASEGLATVVRGSFDEKKLGEVIKAKPEHVVLTQTIGYPK